MNRVLFFFATLAGAVLAEEAPVAPKPEEAPAAPKVEPYQLKNRSVFTLTGETRPPFWPIGWKRIASTEATPVVKGAPTVPVAVTAHLMPEHFIVSSVLVGQPAQAGQPRQAGLATINGRSFAEGDSIPVVFKGARLTISLRAVRDGGVVLECDGNSLQVPLRRLGAPVKGNTPSELSQPGPILIESQAPK